MNKPFTLDVSPDILSQFHVLAERTCRPEAELINEALSGYLEAEQHYREVLVKRLAAADRGEFATDDEVEAFFSAHAEE